jgi:hypothetical protein
LQIATSSQTAILGYVFWEEFESDEAAEASVLGFENDTHAATTELLDNAIMRDGLADHDFAGLGLADHEIAPW